MKLFVANLPHKMNETELKTILTQFGQVASVKLLTDKETGKRKGFGFIEMPVAEQAKAAIAALNGREFYGRSIALAEAAEKQEKPRHEVERPGRGYHGQDRSGEIDGNRW